jgi:hypothetical protein
MREQIELTFFVGYAGAKQDAFEASCIDVATRLCGGCFAVHGTGYWREGSDRHAASFRGPLQTEQTLCLKLTTEFAKEAQVLALMRKAIANQAIEHDLFGLINWVHVQRHAIVGLHFSLGEELHRAA